MGTIVKYSAEEAPVNQYPTYIVSPPHPSPCCLSNMEQIGRADKVDEQDSFYYSRCKVCGFTVRKFPPYAPQRMDGPTDDEAPPVRRNRAPRRRGLQEANSGVSGSHAPRSVMVSGGEQEP